MRKFTVPATLAVTTTLLATVASGVASAHITVPTSIPLGTTLMVCTNHGDTDVLVDGPVHRSWHYVSGQCRMFQNLHAGQYWIGEQSEIDEPSEPCDAAPETTFPNGGKKTLPREHPGYPLCNGYGYYTHHIDVIRPGETIAPGPGLNGQDNTKFRPPVAPVYVNAAPFSGHGVTGLSCLGPIDPNNSNMPTGAATGKACDADSTAATNADGQTVNATPTRGTLNFTVVVLQMHRATGHI